MAKEEALSTTIKEVNQNAAAYVFSLIVLGAQDSSVDPEADFA